MQEQRSNPQLQIQYVQLPIVCVRSACWAMLMGLSVIQFAVAMRLIMYPVEGNSLVPINYYMFLKSI